MKYELHQIKLTQTEIDYLNAANNHDALDKNRLRLDMQFTLGNEELITMAKKALAENYYTHVSNIKTEKGLDGVFEVGNIGPEENIERFSNMSSASVGDIVVDPQGKKHVVAAFGFAEVI